MAKTNITLDDFPKVEGEAGELTFTEGNTEVKIVNLDIMDLIEVVDGMGYLKEYLAYREGEEDE